MNPFIDCSAVCCTELELELEKEHQEYEDLTAKYDLLEEDYVVIKAKLVMEKQDIEREFVTLKKEHETVEGELRTLRETFNVRQDTWIKEKLDMQERVKELEEKELRYAGDGWILERTRLKDIIEEKNQQLERLKRDEEAHRDHIDTLRRDVSYSTLRSFCSPDANFWNIPERRSAQETGRLRQSDQDQAHHDAGYVGTRS